MKLKLFLAVIVVATITACGTSKRALQEQNQLLLTQIAAKQESDRVLAMSNSPIRALREEEPCQVLTDAEEDNMRALGTTIARIEKVARNEALRDARNNLATRLHIQIEGAASDDDENNATNSEITTKIKGSSVINQFISRAISNTKPIKWSTYDLSDGTIQVYVCVELQSEKKNFIKELTLLLKQENIFDDANKLNKYIERVSKDLKINK